MDELTSSHGIIKALKGSEDPVFPGGPSKIELAGETWRSATIHFPNKDEVLVEWILSSFIKHSKDASGPDGKSLVLSAAYWSLLTEVFSTNVPQQHARQIGAWLRSLLNRLSILNIVIAFFKCASHGALGREEQVIEPFTRSMHALWPLASARMNLDGLADCLNAILEYLASDTTHLNGLASACLLIVRSFRQAVGNALGKKKAFSSFIQQSFLHWANLICIESAAPITLNREAKAVKSEVYQTGIEIFFSVDSLKSSSNPLESILTDPKFSASNLAGSQLQIISMLYKSYIHEIRRHRHAVFGSGSNQNEEQTLHNKVRDAGLKTFVICYKALLECGNVLEVWQNMLALLKELEEANLVGYGLSEKTDVLNLIAASAVKVVSGPKVEHLDAAIQILCILVRIEYDLINPFLLEIFSGLLALNPSTHASSQTLLREILDFHSKTRTIPAYLAALLECLTNGKAIARYSDMRIARRDCVSGALLCLEHVEYLSRCIKSFLTPGQTPEVTSSSLAVLQRSWSAYSGVHPVDGTDRDAMDVDATISTECKALAYSLVARILVVIIPSLPFSSLSENACAMVQENIANTWSEPLSKAIQIAFTDLESPDDRWAAQCISAATLRVRHALLMCRTLNPLDSLKSPVASSERIVALIRTSETMPELVVELLRAFFDIDVWRATPDERDMLIEALLAYLMTNLGSFDSMDNSDNHSQTVWDASVGSLDLLESGGHTRGALAVWHLLLDRWLPITDEVATQEHQRRLSRIFLSWLDSCNGVSVQKSISFAWVLDRALRSAAFWELPNLRDAMVAELDAATQCAVWDDLPKTLMHVQRSMESMKPRKSSAITWDEQQVRLVLASFSMLLRAPREYLPRSSRLTFVRRALVADLVIVSMERDGAEFPIEVGRKTRRIILSWILSISDTVNIAEIVNDDVVAYTEYLMRSEGWQNEDNVELSTITLELLAVFFRQIIHSALHGKGDHIRSVCVVLQEPASNISQQGLMKFIEILVAECPNAIKLPSSSIQAIRDLHSNMHTRYLSAISIMLPSLTNVTKEQVLLVRKRKTVSTKMQHAHSELVLTESTSCLGVQLFERLTASSRNSSAEIAGVRSFCTESFLLLLEEIQIIKDEERVHHLKLTASAYLLLGRMRLLDESACDVELGRMLKSIPLYEYKFLLSLLREWIKIDLLRIERGLASGDDSRAVVHLSNVLLGNAPEGAMKVIQNHFEKCLHIFCSNSKFVAGDVDLSVEVLGFVGRICSEKPAYLQHLDVGWIWLLLDKLLAGSTTRTSESHPRILHNICSIASSLIRLRRDLVTPTLPHLGMVLRSLILALQAPRPQLGARQRAQVVHRLPWWISASSPLGITEARAVARLLTVLQAKTIPRTFAPRDRSNEAEKGRTAESLLGAFSKHAGPVLGAYINALVDPLVVLDAGMREALAPGLYALCEAMGEHGRDALMVSGCDAAGKTVFKALWTDYEKQRYVGKG
ncbi:uncharacterized protein FOMMEDRAFT_155506 [Fomitiporia mediterranea MF3/22]|uniref:uncharacterized protein n=1 Tax=Fomitiporia mediterranea (strain MF3/22) TaxID=694068 RepID=UPI0004409C4C|nr:uncharacterized protein FOMMEDRAFT_155506 [Fomitiporia mediterranea MF3/22]EJD04377.1 hypothetical protein FOMMEDRAFT_155506 [Fomitiporia mediterranea MF3/22]